MCYLNTTTINKFGSTLSVKKGFQLDRKGVYWFDEIYFWRTSIK